MPVYSFVCEKCGARFSRHLSYQDYGATRINCPKCGAAEVSRRIGRPRMLRGEGSDLADLDDPGDLAEDPRAMARMMREMSRETGEELGPEFDEVVDRLDKGQSPEDIERELPEMGMGGDDLGAGDEF
ncbi:MAG TPA: zinc ribbon domain-containing protein [Anaerolineales bacterium]|jgi:putative FmdB family regulatory protein